MSQSQHQFDRALSDHRVRVYYGHVNGPYQHCDCARCLRAIAPREGTAIGWWADGLARERRRYICADCTAQIKQMEEAA
jgi:hypothetical protein